MKEIWKEIKGFDGLYEISNLGRVKSNERYAYRKSKNRQNILCKVGRKNIITIYG